MRKIMELADNYARETHPSLITEARAALAAEVDKLEQQVDGISIAMTNANKVLDSVVTERDALREKLATARNAALEEAAKVCDEHEAYPSLTPRHCADAIRALKEQK